MLDTKSTFDAARDRQRGDAGAGQRILENRFYRNVSGALGGTQEYMAMEKLHELHDEGGFDLIVVDTPPTRHALDFLDAPRRLTAPARQPHLPPADDADARVPARSRASRCRRSCARSRSVVGSEVIDDVVAFFRAFEGMEAGFRDRALAVEQLLADAVDRVRARHLAAARRDGRGARSSPSGSATTARRSTR